MVEGTEITVSAGAVGAESAEAARIGAQAFARGGNAMDAAAAACLATAVTMPYYVDIGGYVCAAAVLEAKSGRVWSLDANSIAPAAARPDMFQVGDPIPGKVGINENEYDCSIADESNIYGPLAVAAPGFMAGVGMLWEKWGRLQWTEIVGGSLDLLDRGFRYGDNAREIDKRLWIIRKHQPTMDLLAPGGTPPAADDIWHRPDLEPALRRIASAGWRDVYDGEIGRRVGDYISANGGIMTRADMAAYEARLTDAVETTYRGASVHGAILPNGTLSVLQILNMLERFEPLPLDDQLYWHRLAEILKLAWRDRLRYLGDPGYADVPAATLLDKARAEELVRRIRELPEHIDRSGLPQASASRHGTAHVSAADAEGNLVSVTLSQGNPFGSCVTVPATGFTLGHGMCRFDPRPGRPNSIAPGKRPLNNVCPIIVRGPGRDVAVGMRGGRRIVSVVAQMAHRIVDFGLSPRAAATSDRIHTLDDEPVEYEAGASFPFVDALRRMGHELRAVDELGGTAHCAEFDRATRTVRAGGSVAATGV